MTYTPPATPTKFAAFAATDVLVVGGHNILQRNGLVFNDRSQLECFWVDEFTGFESPDIEVSSVANSQQDGESPDPGFHRSRTMTMSGYIQSGSYPQLLRMSRALLNSCQSLVESPMTISVRSGAIFTQPDVFIMCRPSDKPQLALKPDAIWAYSGLIRAPFTVALRSSDGVYLGSTLKTATLIPQSINQLGRQYDRSYDLGYTLPMTPDRDLAPAQANTLTLTNSGTAPARLRVRFTGYMTGVSLVNTTTNQALYLNGINEGSYVDVDAVTGEVTDELGNLRGSLVDDSSDTLTLRGTADGSNGSNVLQLYVNDYSPNAKVDISWRDTSL